MFNKTFIFLALLLVNSWAGPLDEVVFDGIENEFVNGVKPSEAAKNAAKQTLTETVSRTISSHLGKLYHAGKLPDGIHEALHGASAYTIEKFISGSTKKAKAAAAGAISAEVFGKLYISNADVFNNPNASPEELQKAIDRGVELAEITAASVATALSLDANAAVSAATIAASENSFKKQKEKLARLLQNIQGELDEEFLVQEEQNQAETDAQVAVAKELLAEIKANPAAFFKGCAEVGGEIVVPGGVKHFSALLANKQTLSEFLTNQKRSIGEEVAMGMMVGGKLAKGSKKFKAVAKYVDGKYQAKLANIKMARAIRADVLDPNGKIKYAGKPGRVVFDGVEFRGVRDLRHMSEKNLWSMFEGRAPKNIDGEYFAGHHYKQLYHREPGAFVIEIPNNKHKISNKIQHPNGNKKGGGLTDVQRKDWKKLRPKFYKERARQELQKRGLLDE